MGRSQNYNKIRTRKKKQSNTTLAELTLRLQGEHGKGWTTGHATEEETNVTTCSYCETHRKQQGTKAREQ